MSTTVTLINTRANEFAHPLFSGSVPAGETKAVLLKQVNADDYSTHYDLLPAFGVAVLEDGTPRAGVEIFTGVDTVGNATQVGVIDATAPFVLTLASTVTVGQGFKLNLLLRTSTAVAATGVLTLGGVPGDTEEVVIGTRTYVFQTILTNVAGHVLIEASASDSIDNLIAAITHGAGSGVKYAALTTAHPLVTAAVGAGDTMGVTALTAGAAGNAIITTTDVTLGSWGAGHLVNGDDAGDITVTAAGGQTVLGGATTPLSAEGSTLHLIVDGTDWAAQT